MIIDFHTHIYPERVAAKIFPAAKKKLKVEVPGTGAPDDLRRRMSDSGISRSVLLPLARGREDVSSLNDWILSVSGDGLLPFGAVHPFMENLEWELDRLAACGVRGVKMMPLLQEVFPDDPGCGRLYEALIERKMILVTHAGRILWREGRSSGRRSVLPESSNATPTSGWSWPIWEAYACGMM
jgi:hypothetical protein